MLQFLILRNTSSILRDQILRITTFQILHNTFLLLRITTDQILSNNTHLNTAQYYINTTSILPKYYVNTTTVEKGLQMSQYYQILRSLKT